MLIWSQKTPRLEYQCKSHQNLGIRPTPIIHSTAKCKSSSTNHQFLPNYYSYPQPHIKSSMKMHRKLHFLCSIIWITCIQSCMHLLLLNICITPAISSSLITSYTSKNVDYIRNNNKKIVIVTRCTVDIYKYMHSYNFIQI